MKKLIIGGLVLAVAALGLTGAVAVAGGGSGGALSATLGGFQEVPAISTTGHGTFEASIEDDGLHFTLEYRGLSTPAVQAHIHLGRKATNGGISAFLCGAPEGDACPAGTSETASVSGVITGIDVIGPTGQGIGEGQLEEAPLGHEGQRHLRERPLP